jgi:hypothetical protein
MRYTAYLLLAACKVLPILSFLFMLRTEHNSEEMQSSLEHKIAIRVFFAAFATLANLD